VIYVLGESHAGCTFAGIPGVEAVLVGTLTLKRVGLPGDRSLADAVARLQLGPGDVVLFMFGEIDVRKRLKQRLEREGRYLHDVLLDNVAAYLDVIRTLDLHGARRGCVSVIPPNRTREDNANIILPSCSDGERAEYTSMLNFLLAAGCVGFNFVYVDVYSAYKDADGMLPLECSQIGGSHVSDITRARDTLVSMGLL
jgi:hypothetical protein